MLELRRTFICCDRIFPPITSLWHIVPLASPVSDIWFYVIAIPAVILVGISKGGFGGGIGSVAVPFLSLVMPPLQAAGIMLPVLCFMDLFGLWAYHKHWDRRQMRFLAPAMLAGLAIGTAMAGLVSDRAIRLIVGSIAILFAADFWFSRRHNRPPAQANVLKGSFWATISGFTSFISLAGGPPLQMYLLPLQMDKTVFVGTTVVFFAISNVAKILPYAWLGQLAPVNLTTSLILLPLAASGMILGIWMHDKVNPTLFYNVCYLFLAAAGLKLLYDGTGFGVLIG